MQVILKIAELAHVGVWPLSEVHQRTDRARRFCDFLLRAPPASGLEGLTVHPGVELLQLVARACS